MASDWVAFLDPRKLKCSFCCYLPATLGGLIPHKSLKTNDSCQLSPTILVPQPSDQLNLKGSIPRTPLVLRQPSGCLFPTAQGEPQLCQMSHFWGSPFSKTALGNLLFKKKKRQRDLSSKNFDFLVCICTSSYDFPTFECHIHLSYQPSTRRWLRVQAVKPNDQSICSQHMGVNPKIGGKPPKWMVKIRENPLKMDDLGGPPLFLVQHPYPPNFRSSTFVWFGGQEYHSTALCLLYC